MKLILLVLVLATWCSCIYAAEGQNEVKLPGVEPTGGNDYRKSDLFTFNLSNMNFSHISVPISIYLQGSTNDCTKNEFKCNGKCCPSISTTLEPRTEESSTHPPTTTYGTTTTVQPSTTTNATTTQPSTTTKKPALTWNVTQKADGLPMEKQQLAIDRIVEAFAKYNETDYYNIAKYIVSGFEDKYNSFKWNGVVNICNRTSVYHRYEPPNWMLITRDDNGATVRVWESPA